MGGDYAPSEVILGAQLATKKHADLSIVLYGEVAAIESHVSLSQLEKENITVVPTEETIGMSEHPARAVVQKKSSSINKGLKALAADETHAFIGAGNTGAMLVSSMYNIGVIEGIQRPAICTIVPKSNGEKGILLDVGANADCKPEHLNQFALLGTKLVKCIYGIENPRVGLLSIGEEKEKGNILTQASYPLLEQNPQINFIGNVEGRDIFEPSSDVIVCDGFTGNVVLKTCEGMGYQFLKRGVKDEYLEKFDFRLYGGTPILGVNKPVIIGHGISKADTIEKMVKLGIDMAKSNLIEKIKQSL